MNEENKSVDDSVKVDESAEQKNGRSVSVKEEVMSEKKPESKIVKKVAMGFGVFVVFILVLFIPLSSRTTLGRLFDLVGAHKTAMLMDAFVNRDSGFSNNLARIDIDDTESCANAWDRIKDNNVKFEATSIKGNMSIYPVNEEYKESLNFNSDFAYNFSLKDQKASGDIDFNVNAELSKVSDEMQDVQVNGSAMGIMDNTKSYFKVDEVKVNLEGMNVTFGLDDWYHTPEFGLDNEKKEALNEMAKLITELTETELSKVVSDETGYKISKSGCDFYNKLEVGGIKKVEFGEGDDKITSKVRVIELDMNMDMERYGENFFDNIDGVVNDDTLHNFAKNDFYDWVVRFVEQGDIVFESDSVDFPTKEEFGDEFDKSVTEFNDNKEEIRDYFTEEMSIQDERIEYEILDAVVYLEPGTNDYYGYKAKIKYKLTDEALEEAKTQDEKVYSIIKDGMIVEYEFYDMKLNDKVEPIVVPDNSKPIEEFMKALEDNESTNNFFKNFSTMMTKITGQSSSSNYGSMIYQDEKGGLLYYDGMTRESYKVVESQDESGELFYEDTNTGQYVPIPESVIRNFQIDQEIEVLSEESKQINEKNEELKEMMEGMEVNQ